MGSKYGHIEDRVTHTIALALSRGATPEQAKAAGRKVAQELPIADLKGEQARLFARRR